MEFIAQGWRESAFAVIMMAIIFIIAAFFLIRWVGRLVQSAARKIRHNRTNPFDVLETIKDWQNLGREIAQFEKVDDGVVNIVPFFNLLSCYFDRLPELRKAIDYLKGFTDRPGVPQLIEELTTLSQHVGNAGRCSYGWNRTETGQVVTEEDVFLGDIYGLFTKTVSFWKTRKDEAKGGWEGGTFGSIQALRTMNSYDLVSWQARGFMESHVAPIRQSVKNIFAVGQIA